MTSKAFNFDDMDPVVDTGLEEPVSRPSGEFFNYDAFAESPPGSITSFYTGGDLIVSEQVSKPDTSSEVGVGILHLSQLSMMQVCKGVIGTSSGARFCTKMTCRAATHKQKVVLLDDVDRYFICGPRGDQALTEPSIPVKWVSDTDRKMIESSKKSSSVWKLFFQRIQAENTVRVRDGDILMEDVKEKVVTLSDQLSEIQAAEECLKTPKRTRFKHMDEGIDMINSAIDTHPLAVSKRLKLRRIETVSKPGEVESNPTEQKEKLFGEILGQWNEVLSQIEDLQECLNLNVNLDKTFREKNWHSICLFSLRLQKHQT